MKFVKRRTSDPFESKGANVVEINSIDELIKIVNDEDHEIIIGRDKFGVESDYPEIKDLYTQSDCWFIEIYDYWRE